KKLIFTKQITTTIERFAMINPRHLIWYNKSRPRTSRCYTYTILTTNTSKLNTVASPPPCIWKNGSKLLLSNHFNTQTIIIHRATVLPLPIFCKIEQAVTAIADSTTDPDKICKLLVPTWSINNKAFT